VKRCTNSVWLRRTSNQPAITLANPSSTSPLFSLRGRRPTSILFAMTTGRTPSFPAARSSATPQELVL
jgi:hypothetical protein